MEFILIPVFILACLLLILMIFTVPLYILPVRFAISVLRHDRESGKFSIGLVGNVLCSYTR